MTDERADPGQKTASPGTTERISIDLHEALRRIQGRGEDSIVQDLNSSLPEGVMVAFALGNFSSAFIQALGQRAADGTVRRVSDLVQRRVRRMGQSDEAQIGVDDGSAATIAITEDTPDEARLALLDLDVTADDVRGKVLRWDRSTSAWRPDDDELARAAAEGEKAYRARRRRTYPGP